MSQRLVNGSRSAVMMRTFRGILLVVGIMVMLYATHGCILLVAFRFCLVSLHIVLIHKVSHDIYKLTVPVNQLLEQM